MTLASVFVFTRGVHPVGSPPGPPQLRAVQPDHRPQTVTHSASRFMGVFFTLKPYTEGLESSKSTASQISSELSLSLRKNYDLADTMFKVSQ